MGAFFKAKWHKAGREKFRGLHGAQKLQYIWDYYKFPMAVCGVALYIILYSVYGKATHKDAVLYTALVNVTAGEELTEDLSSRFLEARQIDPAKNKLNLNSGLYLTDDEDNAYHEYTYASRMKILAAIDAKQMDVVIMNKEAFDAFSQKGYLCDLEKLLDGGAYSGLYQELKPYLVTNISILEDIDNANDLNLESSVGYQAKKEEYAMGLDLSGSPFFAKAGFGAPIYLGIVGNSPRMEVAVKYIQYLYQLSLL